MKTKKIEIIADLTPENAATVSTIICRQHPEWGVKRFNYNSQRLPNGYTHSHGLGSNSAILNEEEFKYWGVISFK